MAENSRKKTLPLAVLAAPALAFGSLTFAAVPAMAVPVDEVEEILAEEGIDTVLLVASTDIDPQGAEDDPETISAGALVEVNGEDLGGETFVAENGQTYLLEPFEHATVDQYESEGLAVPEFIQGLENESEEPEDPTDPEEPEDPTDPEEPGEPTGPEEPGEEDPGDDGLGDEEGQNLDVESELDEILPGDAVTVVGSGFTADTEVTLTLDDEQATTTTTTANEDGEIETILELPEDIAPGVYTVTATGSVEGEEATSSLEVDEWPEYVAADIAQSASQARVGDTVRFTIDNVDDLVEEYVTGDADYEIGLQGDFQAADESIIDFGSNGIERVQDADNEYTFDFTIPASVETDSDTFFVEPRTDFAFYAAITFGPESDQEDVDYIASDALVEVVAADPALTVEPNEILLEDFIGDSEEGTGVLHQVRGAEPNSTVEYTVDTPDAIAPFSDTDEANENGDLDFWIHGYETSDPSVYLGDYTTVVTFEDAEGETQELTAEFSVVEGDETAAPVVETDESGSNDEDEAPAVGSTTQLADTGSSGAPLAWIAGGLLALGGAFVLYANRARLFGRKH